jgi:transposase-like protein
VTQKTCPNCGSTSTVPIAKNWLLKDRALPLWHCHSCRHQWGRLSGEKDEAAEIDGSIRQYLEKYPGEKNRLISLIKKL